MMAEEDRERPGVLDRAQLGFGCMRLPVMPDGEIDYDLFGQMVDCYIAHGGRYFDTAVGYHKGRSETAIHDVLVERYPRDSYCIATKMAPWKYFIHSQKEALEMFDTSMRRLRTGYFDCYLFQNMGEFRTEAFDRYGMWSFVKELKQQGKIRHFGISFHDKAEALERILDQHPEIEFVQLQINYADWLNPMVESERCLRTASAHGLPVVVMEPVKGGTLVRLPEPVKAVLDRSPVRQSSAEWALRFAASRPGVRLVLSGMSDMQQMTDNLDFFASMSARPWTEQEQDTIEQAQQALSLLKQIPCTGCGYCTEECPGNVLIPKIMEARNFDILYNNAHMSEHVYFSSTFVSGKASQCLNCGRCEKVCPQQLPVRALLRDAVARYGS